MIGDQPYAPAAERAKILGLENVDARADVMHGLFSSILVLDRLAGDGPDAADERIDVAVAVGMDAIAEEDDEEVQFGIDPEAGTGEAAMPEGPRRKRLAAIAGEAAVDIPAEAPPARLHVPRLGHGADGRRREDADARIFAAAQQHLREDRQISRGGEEARMSGDAAEAIRPRIVDFSLHPVIAALLGRRGAAAEFFAGQVAGFAHAQRGEEMLVREPIEVLPARGFHDLAEHDVAHVAIGELRARLVLQRQGENALPSFFRAAIVVA